MTGDIIDSKIPFYLWPAFVVIGICYAILILAIAGIVWCFAKPEPE